MKFSVAFLAFALFASMISMPVPFAQAAGQASEFRLNHAKELLGKYYKRSVVKAGESWKGVGSQVAEWTRREMRSAPKKVSRKVSRSVASAILSESKRYELDPVFVAAVIQSESSFDPRARGRAGEVGLMQLMPKTAEWIAKKYGLKWKGQKTLLDPVMNIKIGTAYLDFLRQRFDNHSRLYLAAYNMGPKNVDRVRAQKLWPKEYAGRVMKHYVDFYTEVADGS